MLGAKKFPSDAKSSGAGSFPVKTSRGKLKPR
jgi:hypothetical protein